MRTVLKLVGYLLASLILCIIVTALAVYHLVRAGEVQRYLTDEIEKQTELRVQLGGGDLEIGWITGIVFHDLALFEPGSTLPAMTARQLTARIALLPLFRRQVIFYEVRLQEPAARIVRDPEGHLPLLDRLLALQFLKEHESEFSLDLRSIKVDHGNFTFVDQRRKEGTGEWRVANVDLDIKRVRGQGLSDLLKRRPDKTETAALAFALNGDVLRNGGKIDLKARGQVAFPEKTLELHRADWNGDIELVNVPAALVRDYLFAQLPVKSMTGYLAQRIHVEGNAEKLLEVKGTVELRQLSIDAPEVFLAPLAGVDGRVTFALDRTRQQVRITQADLRSRDISATLQGSVSGLEGNDPRLRGRVVVMPVPALTLLKYLPVRIVGSPQLENAVRMIEAGELGTIKAEIDGTFNQLLRGPPATAARYISLQAELRGFAGTPSVSGALPLRGVSGNIDLTNGVLTFANCRGSYGNSGFTDLTGSLDIAGPVPGKLDIAGRGEVDLAELKEQMIAWQLTAATTPAISAVQELGGRSKINIALTRLPDAPLQFEGKALLERARIRLESFSISDLRGELTFTPQEIKSEQLEAQLGGSPIRIRLALKDYSRDDGTFDLSIDSPGVKAGVIAGLLLAGDRARADGIVRGSVRYSGLFGDKERRKLTGDLDLLNVQLLVSPLLQPLRELHGEIKIDETGIDFKNLQGVLVGVPARASGRWSYAGSPQLRFDFAAPNLDITYLISQIDPESSEFYANLVAEGNITLGKGRIKNFDFSEFRTHASIDHRVWRLTRLAAKSAGGTIQGSATIFDKPETLGVVSEPKVHGVPVQSFLKWFDVTTAEMTGTVTLGGKLETVGKNDLERKQNLNGAFSMKIADGTIRRMRILVQILNLLDLSRWFTFQLPDLAKEGIRFRAITGDFKVVNGVYVTENLVVDSDDLRMTGAGKIDVPKNELDFVVAVRPFAGIDTALNYIPLLGRGVAAIKNSILVASFNIQGSIDNPTITPAPLDTVAGWFWGVLGIPKNIIGLGEGEKKPEAAQPPTRQ